MVVGYHLIWTVYGTWLPNDLRGSSSRADVERIAGYVEMNPVKTRLPMQIWPFVQKHDGWLPGLHPERGGASLRNRTQMERE